MLHYAAQKLSEEVISWLIKNGVDPYKPNDALDIPYETIVLDEKKYMLQVCANCKEPGDVETPITCKYCGVVYYCSKYCMKINY